MRIRRKIDSCRRMRRSGSVAVNRRAEESRLIENTDAHQSEQASKRAGREVDMRISTVPTLHGESVVMRILDKSATPLDFRGLGFHGPALEALEHMLRVPQGVVLITGPTGSGKTITLVHGVIVFPTRRAASGRHHGKRREQRNGAPPPAISVVWPGEAFLLRSPSRR